MTRGLSQILRRTSRAECSKASESRQKGQGGPETVGLEYDRCASYANELGRSSSDGENEGECVAEGGWTPAPAGQNVLAQPKRKEAGAERGANEASSDRSRGDRATNLRTHAVNDIGSKDPNDSRTASGAAELAAKQGKGGETGKVEEGSVHQHH